MYTEKHVISLFLKVAPEWKKELDKVGTAGWSTEEPGPYIKISLLAHYIVHSYKEGKTCEFSKIFKTLELIMQEGNNQAKELVTVGLMENLQSISTKESSLNGEVFKPWLGEESYKSWNAIEKFWQGKSQPAEDIGKE